MFIEEFCRNRIELTVFVAMSFAEAYRTRFECINPMASLRSYHGLRTVDRRNDDAVCYEEAADCPDGGGKGAEDGAVSGHSSTTNPAPDLRTRYRIPEGPLRARSSISGSFEMIILARSKPVALTMVPPDRKKAVILRRGRIK